MSDVIRDIEKGFDEEVTGDGHPRSIGLFPIPEYPEFEVDRGMWSAALEAILTTLRYLAPATLLTLFWGQQSFLFKILKSIDSAFRAIVFSSEEQKKEVLEWLALAGPVRVEHLDTVWRHGWIICGVLDSALPGACAGHPPNRLSLKHAQAIADHYLGVEPVFSRQELESNDSLSRHQEWKLATYLDRIRQALAKLTPPVSKPASQRTSPETTQFTLDYVARGSGLTAAQVKNKMCFKIYPTSQQSLDPGEITILIRGPKDTYGMYVIPPILGKAQLLRQKLLGLQEKPHFTEAALPLTQGVTYLRAYGKNNMNKTFHVPKTKYDIDIEVELQAEHAKVSYVAMLEGKHEITITSRGQNIVGSPFSMIASRNIISILEKNSFCLEDGEEIDIVDVKSDRKVVLRIVDFVTEKMLLKENGTLEKITDDEAQILMTSDNIPTEFTDLESLPSSLESYPADEYCSQKGDKFNRIAYKVVQMNRVCKIINSLLAEKKRKEKAFVRSRSQQDIPDIVNSTFGDAKNNPFILHERRDKLIIPEHIKVSLKTEKSLFESEDTIDNKGNSYLSSAKKNKQYNLGEYGSIQQSQERVDNSGSSNNPFLNDLCETNFVMEKDLGSFVKTEYETNKDQIEESESMPIKILIESTDLTPSLSPSPTNPFIEPDIINMERPKTPVLKIITGQVNRDGPIYLDPRIDEARDDILGNEFINPFFMHHHQDAAEDHVPTTDFIIGAPVSLPPLIRASTPEPNMDSIIITDRNKIETHLSENDINHREKTDEVSSVFSTPLHTTVPKLKGIQKIDNINSHNSSTFYSFDSNDTDNIEILSLTNSTEHQDAYDHHEGEITPRKDIWDSAYVSIDDNNSSPDSNNNDNNQTFESSSHQKLNLIDASCDYAKMGPAEREIWQTCSELGVSQIQEEIKPKLDNKRTSFMPILEESDRSISSGIKEDIKLEVRCNENQSVTFAELKNMYRNLISNNENSLSKEQSKKLDNKLLDVSVDSASRLLDVKRHVNETEGKISEVQANVTESVSVSQTLHGNDQTPDKSKDETRCFDTPNNIVLEKKQYWDQKIREIEAKSMEEDKTQQKRKRLSARHLRHNDSLTKRRGKQIIKNLIKASDQKDFTKVEVKDVEIINRKSPISSEIIDHPPDDERLVDKWKKYWDSKLESENDFETTCFRTKSPQNKYNCTTPKQQSSSGDDVIEAFNEHLNESTIPSQVKQELPEEVFKAFETSPKRFFGTSRKQILNKIDNFLGKPSATDESSQDLSGASPEYDAGLVSSRISMFHNISQTEPLPAVPRKYHSMQNIFQRKDSNMSLTRENIDKNYTDSSKDIMAKTKNSENKIVTIYTKAINKEPDKSTEQTTLKNKRARLVKSAINKTFDEIVYKKPVQIQTSHDSDVKKSIQQHNEKTEKVQKPYALHKSLVSKSEMDIFTKISKTPVEDDLDKHKSFEELPKINVKNFINLYESVSKIDVRIPSLDKNNKTGENQSVSSSSTGAVNQAGFTQSNNQRKPTLETVYSSMELTKSPANLWTRDAEIISCGNYEPRSFDSAEIEIVSLKESEEPISLETNRNLVEQANLATSESKAENTELNKEDESITKEYRSRFKMAKEYFQSLEELRETKKPKRPNECELLLMNKPTESREEIRPQKRVKKGIKSHSVPSSEISKIWQQLQENRNNDSSQLVKISEKFNVEDLFNDVTEGKLSRQGSLRGIPHKKAVLEAFRSMDNLVDSKVSSYEISISQLSDFAKENSIKNVQTYLTEYPYLPTTDPSKYHSRLDTKATGLISLKELHNQQKPRRNSVPNLRLNPNSTVQL